MRRQRKAKARSYAKLEKAFFQFHRDGNFCSRLAYSVVTGLSAGKAIAICKAKVATWAGKGHGLTLPELTAYYERQPTFDYGGQQFRTVARELAAKGGKHIIITMTKTEGHAIAIRAGQVVDFTDEGSRKRVCAVFTF